MFFKNNEIAKAYQSLKSSKKGKLILDDILKFCKYNQPSFVKGDPHETAFNEGLKSFARHVLILMNYSESDAQQRMNELKKNINNKKRK